MVQPQHHIVLNSWMLEIENVIRVSMATNALPSSIIVKHLEITTWLTANRKSTITIKLEGKTNSFMR